MPKLTSQQLRSQLGKVCVAIVASAASEMIRKAEAALGEVSFLELRLDYLDHPLAALPELRHLLARHPSATVIATCRRTPNGGRFGGSLAQQVEILDAAIASGFHLIDLEIESAEELAPSVLDHLRSRSPLLIISYHDFIATGDLAEVLARLTELQPDLAKIVPTARTLTDNLALFHLLGRNQDNVPLVAMSMGESGVLSRVLGPRFGSIFTFASTGRGQESAAGQTTATALLDRYRIQQIDADTQIYGVAGSHVQMSLSPLMHNAAFRQQGIDAVYVPLQTDTITDLLHVAQELPLWGFSITMPFKQQILPYLEHIDPLAARIGAVNTVLRDANGRLRGFNTDVQGILAPLERRLSVKGARILLLGAGGAARAAAFGLEDKGAKVTILNRTPEAAEALATQAGAATITRDRLVHEHFDVIVNATPIGMTGFSDGAPLLAEELRADLVFDLVYNPLETPMLTLAKELGVPIIPGLEMFVEQGAKQYELWTGRAAPSEEMTRVVQHALTLKSAAEQGG